MVGRLLVLLAIAGWLPAAAQSRESPAPTSFADEMPPPPPDYAGSAAWAARPGRPGVAAQTPAGSPAAAAAPAADVFYIHPTTYGGTRWNATVDDAQLNAWTDISVVARQAGIFNGCCRIFAPRYRQASGRAFATMAGEAMQAYRLAFQDVARAFDHYLAHDNHGRPFIIVGHSQGALQALFLLQSRIDGTPLQRRLIAAYVVGIGVSAAEFAATLPHMKPCATPTETGCVISWNTFVAGSDTAAWVRRGRSRFPAGPDQGPGAALLCVNPLTFDAARPGASAPVNLGALPGPALAGPLPPLRRAATGARCEGGTVFATPDARLRVVPLPGGSLHMDDMSLFYANIRANALARVRAFTATHR